jgi:hypothetical protein
MARVFTLEEGTNTTASTATIPLDKIGRATNYDLSKSSTNKNVYENMTCPRDRSETAVMTVTTLNKGTNILPSGVDSPATLARNVKFDRGSHTLYLFVTETDSADPTYERVYPLSVKLEFTIPEVNGIDETICAEAVSRLLSGYVSDAGATSFLRSSTTKIIWDAD